MFDPLFIYVYTSMQLTKKVIARTRVDRQTQLSTDLHYRYTYMKPQKPAKQLMRFIDGRMFYKRRKI